MGAEIIPFAFPADRVDLPSMGMIGRVKKLVANSYEIPLAAMHSHSRKRDEAWPRQVAMYLCRDALGISLPKIGREFGNRDHTTVSHALEAVRGRMANPLYRADVEALREALRA
jgi:chromosomal replication initiator protein